MRKVDKMKHSKAAILFVLLLTSLQLVSPAQAEFFSNMGGPTPPPASREASSAALKSIAKVIEAVAALEVGELTTALGTLKEASGMLRSAAGEFKSLSQDNTGATQAKIEALNKDDLEFLKAVAGDNSNVVQLDLAKGATVSDMLILTSVTLDATAEVVDKFSASPSQENYHDLRVSISRLLRVGETVTLALKP